MQWREEPAPRVAEKDLGSGERFGKHASGAEARVDLTGFVPGINPRPTARMSFSATAQTDESPSFARGFRMQLKRGARRLTVGA
jgi:hypothetical protein